MLVPVLIFAMAQPPVSVCDVRNRPSAYVRRLITVHAEVVSAMPHGIYLADDKCPNTVLPLGFDLPDADDTAHNLLSSIWNDCSPDSPIHKTHGDFTGRIVYSEKGRPEIRLQSVHKLDNVSCSTPPVVTMPAMHSSQMPDAPSH